MGYINIILISNQSSYILFIVGVNIYSLQNIISKVMSILMQQVGLFIANILHVLT